MLSQISPWIFLSVKSLIIACVAWLVLHIWQRFSRQPLDPAVEHRVWTIVLAAMLTMPLLQLLVPAARVLPHFENTVSANPQTTSARASETPSAKSLRSTAHQSKPIDNVSVNVPSSVSGWASRSESLSKSPQNAAAASALPTRESTSPSVSPKRVGLIDSLFPFAVTIYLLVTSVLLIRLAVGVRLAHRLVSRSVLLDAPLDAKRFGQWLTADQTVVESSETTVPLTAGLRRSVIILPADWRDWSSELLRMVLTHEAEHVRRHDTRVAFASHLNSGLYWFHPVAWFLRRRLNDLAEQVCDDAVLRTTDDRPNYAEGLLSMAARLTTNGSRIRPLTMELARCSNLETRVETVIDTQRTLSKRLTFAAATMLLLIAMPVIAVVASLEQADEAVAVMEEAEETVKVSEGKTAEEVTEEILEVETQNVTERDAHSAEDKASQAKITKLIAGRVVLEDNKQPVAGAEVHLAIWPTGGELCEIQKTVTNDKGLFLFEEEVHKVKYARVFVYSNDLFAQTDLYEIDLRNDNPSQLLLPLKKSPALSLEVLSNQTNLPLRNAGVRFRWHESYRDCFTDENGIVLIRGLASRKYDFKVQAEGYEELPVTLSLPNEGIMEKTCKLEEGQRLKGRVRDEQGMPIEGVEVWLMKMAGWGSRSAKGFTNQQGEVDFPYLPLGEHQIQILTADGYQRPKPQTVLQTRQKEGEYFELVLTKEPKRLSVRGILTDETGSPIAGALIANVGHQSSLTKKTATGAEGEFQLDNLYRTHSHRTEVYIEAAGYSPKVVEVTSNQETNLVDLDVSLTEKEHRIRGRVLNEKGEPISGVRIATSCYQLGMPYSVFHEHLPTDSTGRFEMGSLPESITFEFNHHNHTNVISTELQLDSPKEVIVTLMPLAMIRGRALDIETGKPISPIMVKVGFSPDRKPEDPSGSISGGRTQGDGELFNNTDGTFDLDRLFYGLPHLVQVKAEGYQREINRRIVADKHSGDRVIDFLLTPNSKIETTRIAGQMIDHNDQVLEGVEVRLVVSEGRPQESDKRNLYPYSLMMVQSGHIEALPETLQYLKTLTDADGQFSFDEVRVAEDIELAYWGAQVPVSRLAGIEKLSASNQKTLKVVVAEPAIVKGEIDLETYPDTERIAINEAKEFVKSVLVVDGMYEINNLAASEYELLVVPHPKPIEGSKDATFTKPTKRLSIVLKPGQTLIQDVGFDAEE